MSSKLTAYATVPRQAIGNCPGNQGSPQLACLEGVLNRCVGQLSGCQDPEQTSVVVLAHALQRTASV